MMIETGVLNIARELGELKGSLETYIEAQIECNRNMAETHKNIYSLLEKHKEEDSKKHDDILNSIERHKVEQEIKREHIIKDINSLKVSRAVMAATAIGGAGLGSAVASSADSWLQKLLKILS